MAECKRIYRYEIPADGQEHQVVMFGPAGVLEARSKGKAVEFWAEHYDGGEFDKPRTFYVAGTGRAVPEHYRWVATCPDIIPGVVWHLFERTDRP